MKRIYQFFLLCCLLLPGFHSTLMATHQVGADFTWACNPQDPCLYTFTYTYYRDCPDTSGVGAPRLEFTCSTTPGGPATFFDNWARNGGHVDITPVCASVQSNCNGGATPGVWQVIHNQTINICNLPPCPQYQIGWRTCCRSQNINSMASPGTTYTYTSSLLPLDSTTCNNSPTFNSVPVVYMCANQSFTYSMLANDPDGDQLQYSLIGCQRAPNNPVNYLNGFSATSPLGPAWNVSMNAGNGDLTFTPNGGTPQAVGVLCVRVDEIRNGVVIGSVVRDIEVRVINCSNQLPTLSGFDGTPIYEAELCVGDSACYNLISDDPDIPDSTFIRILSNPTTANIVIQPGVHETATLCWNPTAGDVGRHTIVLEVRDNACPLVGIQQYTYTIEVKACNPCEDLNRTVSWTSTRSLLDLTVTNTSVEAGVTFTEYCWGDGTPNQFFVGNHTAPVSHTYASAGTYEVCVKLLTYFGDECCHDSLCKQVTVYDNYCDEFSPNFYQKNTTKCNYIFTNTSVPTASMTWWNFGDGSPIATGSSAYHTFPMDGNYTVTMYTAYHPDSADPSICCLDSVSRVIRATCEGTVDPPGDDGGLGGGLGKRADLSWDNENAQLQVELGESFYQQPGTSVELYDLNGKLLYRRQPDRAERVQFDLNGLPGGIYLVRFRNAGQVETRKFVKY